jgi:hypothetical protein
VGHALRSGGLFHLEASRVMVYSLAREGATAGGVRGTIAEVVSESS